MLNFSLIDIKDILDSSDNEVLNTKLQGMLATNVTNLESHEFRILQNNNSLIKKTITSEDKANQVEQIISSLKSILLN